MLSVRKAQSRSEGYSIHRGHREQLSVLIPTNTEDMALEAWLSLSLLLTVASAASQSVAVWRLIEQVHGKNY